MPKVIIIQDQKVVQFNNQFYRTNISEYTKYLNVFPTISYLAQIEKVSSLDFNKFKKIDDRVIIKQLSIKRKTDLILIPTRLKHDFMDIINNHDVFIIKLPSLGLAQYIYKECVKREKTVILEVVGCAWSSYWYYNLIGKLIAPFSYFINRRIISQAKQVIYVTQHYLQQMYPSSGNTIGCSNVELQTYANSPKKWHFQDLASYSLKIGTISPVNIKFRGHKDVLKSLYYLKKLNMKFIYYLIGGGEQSRLRSYIKKYNLQDNVVFVGEKLHTEVLEILDTLDLYIHPSKAEGLPRSLIEAMSRGLPCFAARTSGNPELLDDEFIFDKGDSKQLFKLLRSLNSETLSKMSRLNLLKSKMYDYELLKYRREKFFNSILEI